MDAGGVADAAESIGKRMIPTKLCLKGHLMVILVEPDPVAAVEAGAIICRMITRVAGLAEEY